MKGLVVDSFVEATLLLPERCRELGLLAPFAADRVLEQRFSRTQFRDHLLVQREVAVETVLSDDPAMILYSDPGQYEYASALLRERVDLRFREHGAAHDIALDPERQHLINLSEPARFLSRAYQRRFGDGGEVVAEVEQYRASARILEASRLVRDPIDTRFLGPLNDLFGPGHSKRRSERTAAEPRILVTFGAGCVLSIRSGARVAPGRLSIIFEGKNLGFGRPCGQDWTLVFYPGSLPDGFRCYSYFESDSETKLCLTAWSVAIEVLINALSKRFSDVSIHLMCGKMM